MHQRLIYAQSPKIRAMVQQLDRLIDSPAFKVTKAEGRTRAGFLKCAEDWPPVFIKRRVARSWLGGFFDLIFGSRAARALKGARTLRQAGFHCAAPLGAMDVIENASVRESYLISEPLESAQILSHYALGRTINERHGYARRKAVSDSLAAEVRRLHDAGIYTRDLQETNIMVEPADAALRFYFLDLEDFRTSAMVSRRRRMLNLVHLDRSIGRFVSRAGRLDFFYSYLGRNTGRAARREAVADYLKVRIAVDRRHG